MPLSGLSSTPDPADRQRPRQALGGVFAVGALLLLTWPLLDISAGQCAGLNLIFHHDRLLACARDPWLYLFSVWALMVLALGWLAAQSFRAEPPAPSSAADASPPSPPATPADHAPKGPRP